MGILARIGKWYDERQLQKKVNNELSAQFTDEDREALALINQYGQNLLYYGHGCVNKGRYVRTGFLRKEWRGVYSWAHHPPSAKVRGPNASTGQWGWIENTNHEYQAMQQFLKKYPEYKTRETGELRQYYGL